MVDRIGESTIPATAKPIEANETKAVEAEQKPAAEAAEPSTPVREEELQKFADQVNTFLQPTQTHVQFEYHDELQEYYAVIVDNNSGEIIKEIPSKKILDMYAAMTQFIGLFVDKKA
ncbi:flagellar protein FlaG [Domibacillus sp. DTU_2020_1001157_1_SI_ALB_TIR_016]|uniref:flagellar protein FlaG n=1 Tax=Domibacillus sp. DTU_2020_1001157_1_SI_ALB_TIR_016 TaxID=3077789 RepID=UPI0028E9C34C|nr:flagellar protein FlaG [Domibacillus sp. DTU_2020_1001157_1_SI_ALB_TIR_016]WNS81320.1 flagellar protein FlaG [Domibacillus sp. DTU_2020_1001157_1_SI_ALB_TIR_016]